MASEDSEPGWNRRANVEVVMDGFNLSRFVDAQNLGSTYQQAVAELRQCRKVSHWMWFVFPQLAGLGRSATARTYAIDSLAEARAYLRHDVLGPRLMECVEILLAAHGLTADDIFGGVDAVKLRSSMTLFLRARPGEQPFADVLDRYFSGQPDPATDDRL